MKNKTLQEQYNLIKEGKGNEGGFLREAKRQFPKLIRNAAGLNETVNKLKSKSIISENYVDLNPIGSIESRVKEPWETKFADFLKEAKSPLDNQYKYDDWKNLDNQLGTEVLRGIRFEAEKAPEKNINEIKAIVSKNLAKDSLYYTNNHLFGIEGLKPVQEEAEQTTGEYAGSGYSAKLKKLVKESLMNEFIDEDLDEDAEEDAKNDADAAVADLDYDKEMGRLPMDEDEFAEGDETNEITNEVEEEIEKDTKGKKAKKETVQKTLQRIESIGTRQALEAKVAAIDEEIAKRNEQLGMLDENEAMAELMDKKKLKEMKKDIKVLEKAKMKYEKMCAKYDRK